MNTFAECEYYDKRTGKKYTKFEAVGLICDFCGETISTEHPEGDLNQLVKFKISEIGGAEETWYYYDGPDFGISRDSGIDIHKVFSRHLYYHYCCDDSGVSCSRYLLIIPEGQVPTSLESVMQEARLKVVAKLIGQGKTPKELGVEKDD